MSRIPSLSNPIDLMDYSPTQLCVLALDEGHKLELLKERRRIQVKLNVQKLRLRRKKENLKNEIVNLKNEIETLKKKTEELQNFNTSI